MAGSFSSMKKEKKASITQSPKQPQRGLGVAQLEKIRLQRQIAEYINPPMQSSFLGNFQKDVHFEALPSLSSANPQTSSFVHPPNNIMIAYRSVERPEARYEAYTHWSNTSSSSCYNNMIAPRHEQECVTLPLFEQKVQDSENYMRRKQHEWVHVIDLTAPHVIDLTTPNDEEIDLELRL